MIRSTALFRLARSVAPRTPTPFLSLNSRSVYSFTSKDAANKDSKIIRQQAHETLKNLNENFSQNQAGTQIPPEKESQKPVEDTKGKGTLTNKLT